MNTAYTVVIEKGIDGYFVGSVVELPGCHSQGKSIDELLHHMREAIELYEEVKPESELTPEFIVRG